MRFSRTETSLKALSGRKQLTLNDVLDLFYDLGADIRDDQKMTVLQILSAHSFSRTGCILPCW